MTAIKLFTEPFDLDEVERLLCDDDFLSLARVTIGRESNWRVALDQIAGLLPLFEAAERDDGPLYQLVSMLIQRAGQIACTKELLAQIPEKLGLLPGANYLEEIQLLQLQRDNPEAWQAARNREWTESYKSRRAAVRRW